MRLWLLVLVFCLSGLVFGQNSDPQEGIAFATPPQIFIVVTKPEIGSDLVSVTVREESYSPALLQLQCNLIGKFAGTEIRGYQASSNSLGSELGGSVLKATFACDGLIDREANWVNLDALVKAFLGSSSPMISSFLIHFEGERVGPNSLQSFVSNEVLVEGKILQAPDGIEYRVEVLTQDTRAFKVPGSLAEIPKSTPKPVTPGGMPPFVLPILITGILSAGALVYFALLRPGQKNRKK